MKKNKSENSTIKCKGVYKFTFCDARNKYVKEASYVIDEMTKRRNEAKDPSLRQRLSIELKKLIDNLNAQYKTRELIFENLVPDVGRQQIAKALTTNISSVAEIEINKSELGTGTTTPTNSDTSLDTATFRKDISSLTFSSNVAFATAFYTADDTNGTFFEHGLFINGTATLGDGILFSRVLLNSPTGIEKSSTETLTVDYSFTIT